MKQEPEEKEKIKPVISSANPQLPEFKPRQGELHMIRLDANGAEIYGSDFSINETTYKRTYEKLSTQYKLKKSPQTKQ